MGLTTRKTFTYVKQEMYNEGYKLLSTDYKNSKQYLEFICPNGHNHKIKWNNWQNGIRCKYCSKYSRPMTHEIVNQMMCKENYKLLSKEYINNKSYLKYICPNGHEHKITWNNWEKGKRCPECSYIDGTSKQEKEIREYVIENYSGTVLPNDRTLIQNPLTGKFLELDILLPEINKAIEYNGWRHKEKYQKWKDRYKKQWCKEHGIELLVIDYNNWINNKNFKMIDSFIYNCG